MRKSCFDCVRKHLGSAAVFVKETKMGYPDYDVYVIGELEHAADECLRSLPSLALAIREHRISWMEDQNHAIPFEAIGRYVKICMLAERSNLPLPELPADVLEGLDTDGSGALVTSGDTRP